MINVTGEYIGGTGTGAGVVTAVTADHNGVFVDGDGLAKPVFQVGVIGLQGFLILCDAEYFAGTLGELLFPETIGIFKGDINVPRSGLR